MASNDKLMAEMVGKGNRLTGSTVEAFAKSIGPSVEVFDCDWNGDDTTGSYSPLRYVNGWQRFCRNKGTWEDTAASPTELDGGREAIWLLERAGTAHERFAIGSSPAMLLTEAQRWLDDNDVAVVVKMRHETGCGGGLQLPFIDPRFEDLERQTSYAFEAAWAAVSEPDEPDIDEAQEWESFDPDC